MGFMAIWPNKFLFGEFHVFHGKVVIIGFGCRHGDFGGKLNCGRMKFVLFVVTDWVVSLGEMVRSSC